MTSSQEDISQIGYFYKKSPLGVVLMEESKRKESFKEFFDKKEKGFKEVFEDMMKEPEMDAFIKEKVQEELKKERQTARQSRIKKVSDAIDKAKALFSGGAAYSTIIPPKVITVALEGIKQGYIAGEAVAKVIQDAVDYISKEIGTNSWDTDKFKKEWEEKLGKDKGGKKSVEDLSEEKKLKLLDRYRNKLKGLSEAEKYDVITKAFKKIVENGALDYDDFKGIVAEVLGLGKLSDADVAKIKTLVEEINAVDDLATKLQESDRNEDALAKYKAAKKKAEKSATELGKLVFNRPDVTKRILSIMQLNTLGIPSLVNNPVFNVFNQATVRLPRAVVMSAIDYGIMKGAKLFGKEIKPENNVIAAQKEFYTKLVEGGKQSTEQLFTGLTNKDYFQKEVYASQIHPRTSWQDIWSFYISKDKKFSKAQMVDKWLQATVGAPAEMVARVLNIGDKPQRFAAEGAQAATFAKNLGLQGIDYKLFMEFPKEEAYRSFKKEGMTDEAALKKAEEIQARIIKEGEESVFQEDNLLNDIINGAFEATKGYGKRAYNVGQAFKTLNMPFVKIPLNAFWSVYNLANPEIALLQSIVYAAKAVKSKSPADIQNSKKWFAHAVTGMAWMGVTGAMAASGIINAGNDDEDTKKEREGEQFYEHQHSVNMSKLSAYMRGQDPNKVKNGLNVDLKWLGNMGILMGYQAKKLEELTPEQKEKGLTLMEDMTANLSQSALDFMDKGVFSNTGSMFTAISKGGSFMDNYLLGLMNMGMNTVQPAALAQISRAQLPYYSKAKSDSFMGQLKNNILSRSSTIRAIAGEYPPSKIGIWGDKLDKKDNVIMRLFGMSTANGDNFAQPIYEDYKRTNNTKFFPSAIKPEIINDGERVKLKADEALVLEELIGQERKKLAAPYVNDMATFEGSDEKYSQIKSDEEKTRKLQIIYDEGYENGKFLFLEKYPQYKPKAKTIEEEIEKIEKDVKAEIFRDVIKSKSTL